MNRSNRNTNRKFCPFLLRLSAAAAAALLINAGGSGAVSSSAGLKTPAVMETYAASTVTITYDANGGTGTMAPQSFPAAGISESSASAESGPDASASSRKLSACTFTRYGYIFRGWMTAPDGTECEYEDQEELPESASSMRLYALWEPQMYIIHYEGGGAPLGTMEDSYAIYDQPSKLSQNLYVRPGHLLDRWIDTNTGRFYEDRQEVLNLHSGNTCSRAVLTVDVGRPLNTQYSFKSTQGSCVYEKDGIDILVTAASINDSAYNSGDLSHYETILTQYDMHTGEVLRQVRNLPFDHGNGICYNPDNGHLYIAEGGSKAGYPSGVMELDGNLQEVQEYNFPLLTHIWGIAYADSHFYLIGRNDGSRNSLCVLNSDMQTLSITPVDEYYTQNFSSQGIASDGTFLYAVSAGFRSYDWKSRQRINVFSTDGTYLGVWTIDIPYEAEDLTIVGPYAYITTNEGSRCTLYRTRIPAVTLHALWK